MSGAGDFGDNRTALAAILHTVLPEMQAGLAVKPTVSMAWEVIQRIHVSTNRVKEANAECLWREFTDLAFNPSKSVEDFSLHLNTMAS
jgi:hypothetical protein